MTIGMSSMFWAVFMCLSRDLGIGRVGGGGGGGGGGSKGLVHNLLKHIFGPDGSIMEVFETCPCDTVIT